ncbi:FAD-binding domain-containing protein [Colletotrichum orchidophilum]|uniref:ferric-chelate reductase (NADPH) n=1 Tax=Colletotrichum orchidophilum TaxID=1209926 RepID=A0A1G4AMG9_9PEZI|nr:FAD-binding domain-containing protein [Colletotrichum orchidophilum]OHE90321.1 FAD-binding domain-containing protein [Colletotrichum orchidophilum]
MNHNRKTQIAIFSNDYNVPNAAASDPRARPATHAAAGKADRHLPVQTENQKKERFLAVDSAKGLHSPKHDNTLDRPSDVENGSPWKHYQAEFELQDLGGTLTVASRHRRLFHISELARTESKEVLEKLRRLRHPNVVEFIHAYMTPTSLHAVFEATAVSLLHVAKCPTYPDKSQLGAIVGQARHSASDVWNRVANQQLCQPLQGHSRRHLTALSRVVQLLMQKYCKETPGIDDLGRWPPDSDGFTFLVAIDSASSVVELQNVPPPRQTSGYGMPPRSCQFDTRCGFSARVQMWGQGNTVVELSFSSLLFTALLQSFTPPSPVLVCLSILLFFLPVLNSPDQKCSMDWVTVSYAICLAGMIVGLAFLNVLSRTGRARKRLAHLMEKYLVYRLLVHRHSLLGPWSAISLLVPTLLLGVNVFCLAFRPSTILARSGNLALLNMLPLFSGPCLDFTADMLAVPFQHYVVFHRWQGRVATMLLAGHIISAMEDDKLPVQVSEGASELLMVTGSIAMVAAATMTFLPFFRRRIYELCLRTHQALSCLAAVGLAFHLRSMAGRSWLWLSVYLAVTVLITFSQVGLMAFRNKTMGRTFGRAYINHDAGAVRVSIQLSRPLAFEAGQYLLLWMPRVRLLESHPFVVTSWAEAEQGIVDLFIEPRRGFTSSLVRYSHEQAVPRLAFLSGPHGVSVPVWDYEAVLMVATGHGIAAQAPYLKKLVYGYNHCRGRTRQIHLVWQVANLDIVHAAESILNPILNDDTLDNGYILEISIFLDTQARGMSVGDLQTLLPECASDEQIVACAPTHVLSTADAERLITKHLHGGSSRSHGEPTRVKDFGTRARLYVGSPDLTASLWAEASHLFGRTSPDAVENMGDMLILGTRCGLDGERFLTVLVVSAANATRDVLCDLAGGFLMDENHPLYSEFQRREDVREYLQTHVWLRGLDYQPAD